MNENSSVCDLCCKAFSSKKNLYKHIRKVHNVEPNIPGNILCPVKDCSIGLTTFEKLRNHIEASHFIEIAKEILTFQDKPAYYTWKDDLENTQNVSFYIETFKTLQDGSRKQYLRCHRSGSYISDATNRIPSGESCKIGRHCPATMEVTFRGSSVEVTHYKTHVGHALEMKHQKISKTEREEIRRKLKEGVPVERILDDIRDSSSSFQPIHLLKKKDIQNIGHSHNLLRPERFHEDDTISVHMFVKQMKEMGDASPVAFFKAQGESFDGLELDDFMLVLFSTTQMHIFEKFCNDKICIDTTHGTNEYKFNLTSVVVVDEFERGFPVAFCISNKISEKHISLFLQSIKDKLNVSFIPAKVFMSDDYPAYYNAWVKIMGPAEKQLLCVWHVDKNWRQALSKIKNVELRPLIYKYLRTLLEETDETLFLSLRDKFIFDLENNAELHSFSQYFKSNYLNRCRTWAYCYRQYAGINTNMYLESLHKVLKYIYMQGKINKRLDKCIYLLQKLVRDKSFERYIRLIKGSSTEKNAEINTRHKDSKGIPNTDISSISSTEWTVKSQSSKLLYSVKKFSICENCYIKCKLCCTCVHEFSCTCIDNSIKGNMCKHIHAVAINLIVSSSPSLKTKQENEVLDEINLNLAYNQNIPMQSNNEIQAVKHKLSLAQNLIENSTIVENLTPETIIAINKHIDKALSLLQSGDKTVKQCESQDYEPANKRLAVQRLHSTKRPRKTPKSALSKPTVSYKLALLDSVNDDEILDINYGNDHDYTKQS